MSGPVLWWCQLQDALLPTSDPVRRISRPAEGPLCAPSAPPLCPLCACNHLSNGLLFCRGLSVPSRAQGGCGPDPSLSCRSGSGLVGHRLQGRPDRARGSSPPCGPGLGPFTHVCRSGRPQRQVFPRVPGTKPGKLQRLPAGGGRASSLMPSPEPRGEL